MATITFSSDGPTSRSPIFGDTGSPIKLLAGTMDFDSSYPTGGEDISTIFDRFNDANGTSGLMGITFSLGAAPVTIDTKVVNRFGVDYANKKVLLYGDDTTSGVPAQVADTTNASTVTGVRWLAWGRK